MTRLALIPMAALLLGASPARPAYHWFPAKSDVRPRPWAILFPRAMGVGKLVPGNQYVSFARLLNERGIDALIIDDDTASALIKPKGTTGQRLAALAADALADARAQGRMDMRCPGLAVGWSRGGEGALALASQAEGGRSGVKAAVVWYPSVRGQLLPWKQLHPVLALQGTDDQLAPHTRLEALVGGRTPKTIEFTVKLYPGARHRFDVIRPGDQSYDPGVLPRDHDAVASMAAYGEVRAFLDRTGLSGQSCALD